MTHRVHRLTVISAATGKQAPVEFSAPARYSRVPGGLPGIKVRFELSIFVRQLFQTIEFIFPTALKSGGNLSKL